MSLGNTELLPSEDITVHSLKEENEQCSVQPGETVLVESFNQVKQESTKKNTEYSKQHSHASDHDSLKEEKVENEVGIDVSCQKCEQTHECKSHETVPTETEFNNSEHQVQCQNQPLLSETSCSELQKTGADAVQKNEAAMQCSVEHDPYFYTKREDFTSEIFKIEIRNLPSHLSYGQLRKFFNVQLGLGTHKIKPVGSPRALQCVYATFKNEEKRETAMQLLDGYEWRGRKLVVKKANPMADPLVKKRSAGDSEDAPAVKKIRQHENIPVLVRIKNAVTPLWNVSYEEQLKIKESDMQRVLTSLGREIEMFNKSFHKLPHESRKANSFRCCPMAPVKASPCVSGYRNKCEFTVGRHLDTNEKVVGFRLSSYKEGSMSVAEPDECPHISQTMLKAVKCFQAYIQASDKDVYNPETHEGYWRQLTVRTSRSGDMMIIIVMHPQNLSESELEKEKQELTNYIESGPAASCGITSAFFQIFARKQSQHEEANLIHLFGKKFIEEILLGNTFRISPNAFFQVNSDGAEVLYSTVAEVVGENKSSAVLDICCGTGTIGICLSKQALKVVGIEMVQQAVEDAKVNAQINGITNVEFVQGKAEDVITDVIGKLDSSELTAVVDPPRAGLHPKVLKVIRGCEKIRRLIYVSCNVKAAMTNFVDLCRPPSNNYRGQPFYPVQAIPIDLFPHTPYCELILIFERPNTSTLKK